jgi:hypothetical protein
MTEMLRFAWASLKQLVSAQGPAYVQFLSRVITQHPDKLRDAFALAAKGYHLRKITEQVTAVDNFKRYLTREIEKLHKEMARRAQDGNTRIGAYVHDGLCTCGRSTGRSMQTFVTTSTICCKHF